MRCGGCCCCCYFFIIDVIVYFLFGISLYSILFATLNLFRWSQRRIYALCTPTHTHTRARTSVLSKRIGSIRFISMCVRVCCVVLSWIHAFSPLRSFSVCLECALSRFAFGLLFTRMPKRRQIKTEKWGGVCLPCVRASTTIERCVFLLQCNDNDDDDHKQQRQLNYHTSYKCSPLIHFVIARYNVLSLCIGLIMMHSFLSIDHNWIFVNLFSLRSVSFCPPSRICVHEFSSRRKRLCRVKWNETKDNSNQKCEEAIHIHTEQLNDRQRTSQNKTNKNRPLEFFRWGIFHIVLLLYTRTCGKTESDICFGVTFFYLCTRTHTERLYK